MATLHDKQTANTRPKVQRDPAMRMCPNCLLEIVEMIPLDANGTCHGCGRNFGKPQKVAVIGNGPYARTRSSR